MSATRFKTVLPLAVHLVGHIRLGGKPNISQQDPSNGGGSGRPQSERQGKKLYKTFQVGLSASLSGLELVLPVSRVKISDLRKC